jgi:D-3-phosphoglycerate dehydrogenase
LMTRILLVEPIHQSGIDVFGPGYDVRIAAHPSEEVVMREIAEAAGAIVRTALFTRAMMTAAPRLKVIGRHGVGVDNIDVAAATELGIVVVNTPNANAQSVAEHTVAAIGALAKRMLPLHRATVGGHWSARNEYRSVDLAGKTLGLVGLGRIGSLVAHKCRAAYDMQVIAFDPHVRPEHAAAVGATLVDQLDCLLATADFVSLHVPLTAETCGLIDARRLALMKPTAYLLNMARGGVVKEADLVSALQTGALAGAALDVFEKEPPAADNPLLHLDNVLLTPHSAALTQECVVRMATGAAQGVKDVLEGRAPESVVNPEVLAKL